MEHRELVALVNHAFAHEFNHTLHAYIDIADDLVAGTLLGQIMYWFSTDENGKRKVRVFKEDSFWLAKKREDWYSEIRISPKQYDRAIKILAEMNLVEVKRFKFNGDPVTHIRPIYENINKAVAKWKQEKAKVIANSNSTKGEKPTGSKVEQGGNWNFTFGEERITPSGNNQLDQRGNSLTEITTEPTTEIKEKDILSATPMESESKKPQKKSAFDNTEAEKMFCILWDLYPTGRKQGKPAARKHFMKALKDGVDPKLIKQKLLDYKKQIEILGTETRFIKQGSTWFNGGWEDEYITDSKELKGGRRNGQYTEHTEDPFADAHWNKVL